LKVRRWPPTPGSAIARVSLAIQWIRRDFAERLRVDALAHKAAMTESAFHRQFKALTALSPLQPEADSLAASPLAACGRR
jgi:transcriptional regulator GlxA family with amidase domain